MHYIFHNLEIEGQKVDRDRVLPSVVLLNPRQESLCEEEARYPKY